MATWTVSGLGSNSTGAFTFPANTGTTDKSYTVTYDDGNGNTATTSVTVPACDIEYVLLINGDSIDVPCSGGTTGAFISSYTRTSSQDFVSTANCSVTSAPSWISSYSLSPSEIIGGFELDIQVPASTTSARSGTFTITQDESGKKVSYVVNQPACTPKKTVNNITSSADASGAHLYVYLQSESPLPVGTSIQCEVMVTYTTTATGVSNTKHLNVTIPGGSSSGSYSIPISDAGLWRVDSCCITATNLLYEDDTYDYRYLTCGGWIS